MRKLVACLILSAAAVAQDNPNPQLPKDDATRVREFYRIASQVQDSVWPGWSKIPSPLLLVTPDTEFLTHHPSPPPDMKKIADGFYARPRQFPTNFQATFPAFGPPSVIVIGEPENTESKTSTPWLFTVMHEHFHQLQNAQPGYFDAVNALNLSQGDTTGMWMLNFPFPYEKPEVIGGFAHLRDLLLRALEENDQGKFAELAKEYVSQRRKFFGALSPDDRKYFNFQLWQEGIARYTEVKSAEACAACRSSAEFASLKDYEPFASFAARTRKKTLDELRQADLAAWKRVVVYSFGAAEGFLLDRINPNWKDAYFKQMLSLEPYFDAGR
jgi:hypothetical protein